MDHKCLYLLLLLLINNFTIYALEPRDILIIILSQNNSYNNNLAQQLQNNIQEQSKMLNKVASIINISNYRTDWTILTMLHRILENNFVHWLFICSDRTHINLENLINTLNKYDYNKDIWLGHAMFDKEPTIIHHFLSTNISYPNLDSGFAISMPFAAKINNNFFSEQYTDVFSIDVTHELSLFIWEKLGISLNNEPNFCITNSKNCATYISLFKTCGDKININNLYFAVKTHKKNHDTRLKIVHNTWARYTKNINYFSDFYDENLKTIVLNVPNTKTGHCRKTFEIIKYFYNNFKDNKNIKYLVITDDDTIISPYRVTKLINCYNQEKYLALGQRYGYQTLQEIKGYNYLTGGSGFILNKKLVKRIINNPTMCSCPKPDSPDDMILGVCFERFNVEVIHSNNFHQARPNDYPEDYLSKNEAISFHKHWMTDPEKIYIEWFKYDDENLLEILKDEL